jgi:propionyl-CoA synthetase
MGKYTEFHKRSIDQRDEFWAEQSALIDWQTPPKQICDFSRPPFAKWFVGGKTNLCHNAVDRHAARVPTTAPWSTSRPRPTKRRAIPSPN